MQAKVMSALKDARKNKETHVRKINKKKKTQRRTTMKTRDLGTYFIRIDLEDGGGWIHKVTTGARYTDGSDGCSPLTATRISPTWKSEQHLIDSEIYMFTEGNFSCDCNKRLFLARANRTKEPCDICNPCGDTIIITKLTLIKPDKTEQLIWEKINE